MIYNAGKVRRLPTKFQVDTCKIKKERIVHVQLRQAMIYTVAHLVIQIQAMIYNAARVRSFSTKLQADTCKSKEDRYAHMQLHTLWLRSKP